MTNSYPSVGEYNLTLQKKGGKAFNTLNDIKLIPSFSKPILVYLFGSGAYAAVFKGTLNEKEYAIRCFLSADDETILRYQSICDYLKTINSTWKTNCEFINNEIVINENEYPIIKMDWLRGILINQFVTINLNDNSVLTELQNKIIEISNDLEKKMIGHGDIQCGNILITGYSTNFQIKLIDYDGMYVPDLIGEIAIEKGRSEFQHPKKTLYDFGPKMDRFSFWVIITAIEALKIDKSLWLEVMQGGFNNLDNFLFTVQDFLNPKQSKLFNYLYKLNSNRLNFYLNKLVFFCNSDYSEITKPIICPVKILNSDNTPNNSDLKSTSKNTFVEIFVDSDNFIITSNTDTVSILTASFQKLGFTPLKLDKNIYDGKTIIISNSILSKQLNLNAKQIEIRVELS